MPYACTPMSSRPYNNSSICAYLKITETGKTFITEEKDYLHITGAYCLPDCRGKGIYRYLLEYAVNILNIQGYTRLGVDFESINPTAYGFWLKSFTPYTYGVVRRIDERIIDNICNDITSY